MMDKLLLDGIIDCQNTCTLHTEWLGNYSVNSHDHMTNSNQFTLNLSDLSGLYGRFN